MAQTLRLKSPLITLLLVCILLLQIWFLYALFIGGPVRIHQLQQQEVQEIIYDQVPELQGLDQNRFAYITYQGYTDTDLYWFDADGNLVTTRSIDTLDYERARQIALAQYDLVPVTVSLAFGYSHPVYLLQNEGQYLMLDYDTFQTVYYRNNVPV